MRPNRVAERAPSGHSGAVTFSFTFDQSGRRRRVVFEERFDVESGTRTLVATQVDGDFTADEIQCIRADAFAKWLYSDEPPKDWFDDGAGFEPSQ